RGPSYEHIPSHRSFVLESSIDKEKRLAQHTIGRRLNAHRDFLSHFLGEPQGSGSGSLGLFCAIVGRPGVLESEICTQPLALKAGGKTRDGTLNDVLWVSNYSPKNSLHHSVVLPPSRKSRT